MARLLDTLQQILTTTERIARLDKRQAEAERETRHTLLALQDDLQALDRRVLVLETRFSDLSHNAATEARAAAQSAATLAVASELRGMAERIARLEGAPPQRLAIGPG